MKTGLEVEGRYKGIETVFMNQSELGIFYSAWKANPSNWTKIKQVYISDLNSELVVIDNSYLDTLSNFFIITVETKKAYLNKPHYLNVMLQIDCESFWALGEWDQIKFTKDNNVYAIPKENMYRSIPADFLNDTEVSL